MAIHTDVNAVRKLMTHAAFTLKNPNRARSLIFSFCSGHPPQFHAADGSGYAFWAEQVIELKSSIRKWPRVWYARWITGRNIGPLKKDAGCIAESSIGQGNVEGCAGGGG